MTITAPSLPGAEVGLSYNPMTYTVTGGNAPYLWRISGGSLPSGLDLSLSGTIAGTPTHAGDFSFTVAASDAAMVEIFEPGAITVAPRLRVGLIRSTISPRRGSAAGSSFASVSGGSPPYSYALSAGTLPAGTRLSGLSLMGTFTTVGTYKFTIVVKDGLGASASISPTYVVWDAISFAPARYPCGDSSCPPALPDVYIAFANADGGRGSFPYTGGTPGAAPIVTYRVETVWGNNIPLNGLTVAASAGAVRVSLAPNVNPPPLPGVHGGEWAVYVTLTDPQTHESTREARFEISTAP